MPYTEPIIHLLKQKDYTPTSIDKIEEALGKQIKESKDFRQNLRQLIKQGTLVRLKGGRICLPSEADLATGIIRFRQNGSAILLPDTLNQLEEAILINAHSTGVSRHGDKVLVRKVFKSRDRYQGKKRKGKPEKKDKGPTGKVIRILERAHSSLTGTLKRSRLCHYIIPDDPRIPDDILVADPQESKLDPKPKVNDKVVVQLAPWEHRHLNPEGEIIEVLGETHTPHAEYLSLLHQYNLDESFPESVCQEVSKLPSKVGKKDIGKRMDLRKLPIFTIDPDDAKDFDDALSVERQDDGSFRIGIHIADVAHYVKRGTSLDKEAQQRGNSTYLVGKVIPMLPQALSNGLCSLVEAEDRLTKSVFIYFSEKGLPIFSKTEFASSVICSQKRLTYKQAYALLKEDDLNKIKELPLPAAHDTGSTGVALNSLSHKKLRQLQTDIRQLWFIASKLRKARMNKGSLDLDMPETKIIIDAEGYAERIEKIVYDESHQLIEEFMLAANEAVAKALKAFPLPLINRVHDDPDPDKLEELSQYYDNFGIPCGDLSSRKNLCRLLGKIKNHPQNHLLKIELLRSLKQACYRADKSGHFGLCKADYTHFTSPIRRYSDLITHRIFDYYLQKTGHPTAPDNRLQSYKHQELISLAQHISLTEQNSTQAERDSVKIKLMEFFEKELKLPKHHRNAFPATIIDIKTHGLFVELNESLAYGFVHVSSIRNDIYKISPDGTQLRGRRKHNAYKIGQTVNVIASKVDRFKKQIDFNIKS